MALFKKKAKKESKVKRVKPKKQPTASKKKVKGDAPRKATEKITPKKVNKSKKSDVELKKTKKKVKVIVPVKEKEGKRVYHVSKRAEDGMWAVKFAGGEKAIKLFKTKDEALEYTKKLSENQDGVMLVHNSKGKNKGRIQ